MPITPPIFVHGDDLYIFTSVAEAVSYLEPVDVEPEERGYDSEGRLLRVVVRGEVRRSGISIDQSRAQVELVLAEEAPGHEEELRAVLGDWLARVEKEAVSPEARLPDLVRRARKYALDTAVDPHRRVSLAFAVAAFVLLGLFVWWRVRR